MARCGAEWNGMIIKDVLDDSDDDGDEELQYWGSAADLHTPNIK